MTTNIVKYFIIEIDKCVREKKIVSRNNIEDEYSEETDCILG